MSYNKIICNKRTLIHVHVCCYLCQQNCVCFPVLTKYFNTRDEFIWAATRDFQQCGIVTSVDSDEPMQPPFKLRNCKCCSVSSLKLIEYSSDLQRLWSDCAYAQADLRLCWSHVPHCWKSPALAQLCLLHWIIKSFDSTVEGWSPAF